MQDNNQKQTNTSTQIRNFYSDGMAYLNVSFFNTYLSFKFYPFMNKDNNNNGRSVYDLKHGVGTTVNFEGAYTLYDTCKKIIDGEINEANLSIPCAAGAMLNLERKLAQNGTMETVFSIAKNNIMIPFKFKTITVQVKENNQVVSKVIESGLGAFMKTIDGYLQGINSDRHLDKMTEDYAKLQDEGNNNSSNQYQYQRNNNGNNGYRKNYNNNGYRRQYNNNQGGFPMNNPNQQNLSTYQIQN